MGNALEFLPIPTSPLPKLLHLPSSTSVKVVVVVGAGKKPVLSLKARKYRMQRSKRRQNAFLLLNLGKMEHKKNLYSKEKRKYSLFLLSFSSPHSFGPKVNLWVEKPKGSKADHRQGTWTRYK